MIWHEFDLFSQLANAGVAKILARVKVAKRRSELENKAPRITFSWLDILVVIPPAAKMNIS